MKSLATGSKSAGHLMDFSPSNWMDLMIYILSLAQPGKAGSPVSILKSMTAKAHKSLVIVAFLFLHISGDR